MTCSSGKTREKSASLQRFRGRQGHGRGTSAFGAQICWNIDTWDEQVGAPWPIFWVVGVLWGGVTSGRALRPCPLPGQGRRVHVYFFVFAAVLAAFFATFFTAFAATFFVAILFPPSVDFVLRTSFFTYTRSVPRSILALIRGLSASQYVRTWRADPSDL